MLDERLKKDHGKAFEAFESFMVGRYKEKGSLMDILSKAQELFGCIPEGIVVYISRVLVIPESQIYGVITFYPQFIAKEEA